MNEYTTIDKLLTTCADGVAAILDQASDNGHDVVFALVAWTKDKPQVCTIVHDNRVPEPEVKAALAQAGIKIGINVRTHRP